MPAAPSFTSPPFKASLITPEAVVLKASVIEAQIPAFDGLLGILDKRAPLTAKLSAGILRLTTASGPQRFFIDGGYAQMKDDELTILTTEAIPAEKVTSDSLTAEQKKLDAIQGVDAKSLAQRSHLQSRMQAMRTLVE
ncbi:MAG: F0F1 ATP synthase subunit epsilon [Phycisphaerales bacterium]|nr:F0F1 ATP synthase subunit epsilon [Phycisphaerales bacterium]